MAKKAKKKKINEENEYILEGECMICHKKKTISSGTGSCKDCDDVTDDEIEELSDAIDSVKKTESKGKGKVCSFQIEVNKLRTYLKALKCTGYDSRGSKSILISDCIIRFDTGKNQIWSIVVDEKRNIVAQVKADVVKIINPVDIPVEIVEIEKWVQSFDDNDVIQIIYEKGIIGLKSIIKKEFLDFDLETKVVFSTKRMDTISYDLISNLEYGDDKDKKNLDFLKNKLGNSIYKVEDGTVTLFFNIKLPNKIELSSRQIKMVIQDGERVENRVYPFEFQKDKLRIVIKSSDPSIKNEISRDLYSKKYNVTKPFKVTFASRLTNAVNNLSGYIQIHAAENSPMLLKSVDMKEKGLDICYLVTKF